MPRRRPADGQAYQNKEATVTQKSAKLSRRNFLLTVGAGGAATAAAVVAGRKAAPDGQTAQAADDKRGYQETAHVNNYYRTTKV